MYGNSNNVPNGSNPNHTHQPNGHHHPPQRPQPAQTLKEPITVVGIPSVSIQNNRLLVGSSQSSSTRSYTPLKVLGDGSFGTVWLCDWHGTLPPNTPLSPMQCGPGARPEWQGKRLVAVKRMKKQWEGGWDECQKLKELESLRAIPFHPNIIPLYDFFLLPATKELYFVFESMEGNLYHLIKARKGRPLAGGLVSSIFRQVVAGLDHIHSSGYFHRDMKPENVLVTTIGLHEYNAVSPHAPPIEKDVVAIIKLADFGLARETKSKPPYTEYVSTRWYRAPEVLLLSRDYSNPVDMWALGTIMAELVNLRPLFPGSGQVDQVARICEILGDPSDDYGIDSHGNSLGGGKWPRGIKLAKAVGFAFPKIHPKDIYSLFDRSVPTSLIQLIGQLLKYDPDARLTSWQCLEHKYLQETLPCNNIPLPPSLQTSASVSTLKPSRNGHPSRSPPPAPSEHLPPPSIPDASSSHRTPFFPPTSTPLPLRNTNVYQHPSNIIQEEQRSQVWGSTEQAAVPASNGDYLMDDSPHVEKPEGFPPNGAPMEVHNPPQAADNHEIAQPQPGKKFWKWVNKIGGDKSYHNPPLPPVPEAPHVHSHSTPSLGKRTQSPGPDSSFPELPPVVESTPQLLLTDPKKNKKEAQRLQREAEKQRRALAEKMQREQARAVILKRNQMIQKTVGNDIEWMSHGNEASPRGAMNNSISKGKQAASGPIRQNQGGSSGAANTINAAAGRFTQQNEGFLGNNDWRRDNERVTKVRRQEFDDGHSTMSSSDVHSIGRMSAISFASATSGESDPGPTRIRRRPSLFGINRMTSTSSLRTSFDDFPPSARSSNSFSLEGQLANDFRIRASVGPVTPLSGNVSPPPIHMLSLSPTLSPSLSSSPPWIQVQQPSDSLPSQQDFLAMVPPSLSHLSASGRHSPYQYNGQIHGHPPSPGFDRKGPINPIFKVPSLPSSPGGDRRLSSPTTLPPFSHLEAVAEGEYPPLSPMAFHNPEEDTVDPPR